MRKQKKDVLPRLEKIEGQIRGIHRMVEKERYRIDIVNQVTAAQRALDQASLKVMRRRIFIGLTIFFADI